MEVETHPIKNEYNDALKQLTTNDPVHADTYNPLFGQLINNDAELHSKISTLETKVGAGNSGIVVSATAPTVKTGLWIDMSK